MSATKLNFIKTKTRTAALVHVQWKETSQLLPVPVTNTQNTAYFCSKKKPKNEKQKSELKILKLKNQRAKKTTNQRLSVI